VASGIPSRQGGSSDPSTPEGGLEAFLKALVAQDKESLSNTVSSRAAGDLAKIRKGEADSRIMTKLSETYGRLHVGKVVSSRRGDERLIVLSPSANLDSTKDKKGLKQAIVRKEENVWKVFELK
jgi:hypothetical protein